MANTPNVPTKVLLGVHDVRETPPCLPETGNLSCGLVQVINIAEVLIHDAGIDIGLIRLTESARLREDHVYPICLPLYATLRMHMPVHVIITGWGITEKKTPSHILMKANSTVMKRGKTCPNDHEMCAGGVNLNTPCRGDTGGPYQAISKFGSSSSYVQYGIISDVPPDCLYPEKPSSGPLVAYYIDWILDRIEF
uniref:Peptidase S1 domain-containing protein n=1 Tax=Anopheles farauti TaxID=69004 RepID=A0A182Q2H5_9DIPT